MKDIFIDTNIASRFTNPVDTEYKKLIEWLRHTNNEQDPANNAYLVVSKKLLGEYYRSAMNANTQTCIPSIIDLLTREGRLNSISNDEIKNFIKVHYSKKQIRRFTCNNEDRELIPIVLLSNRKFVLTLDANFSYDLIKFPGFNVTVSESPQDLNYL